MGIFKPVWMNKNKDKALTAVKKLTDQAQIARAAKEAPDSSVRSAAVEMLTDQNVLTDIAKNDASSHTRAASVRKLDNQVVLADIVKCGDDHRCKEVVKAALEVLTDQTLLVDIVKNESGHDGAFSNECSAFSIAFSKVTDQAMLADLVKHFEFSAYMRSRVVSKLTDVALLDEMCHSDKSHRVRKEALLRACSLKGHDWDGCECRCCGQMRDKQHDWDGCKCKLCGQTRDEQHDWDGCKCRRCGQRRDAHHDWDGCKCRRCGLIGSERHDWDGCKCRRCGQTRDEQHDLDGCICRRCGREIHDWEDRIGTVTVGYGEYGYRGDQGPLYQAEHERKVRQEYCKRCGMVENRGWAD